jgi:hypothetical protein
MVRSGLSLLLISVVYLACQIKNIDVVITLERRVIMGELFDQMNTSNKVNIKTHHYFPFQFIILGVGLIITGMISMGLQPLPGVGLMILGLIFTTTHYRLQIDTGLKKYKEYLWLLGYQRGETLAYHQMDHIYINKVDMSSGYGFVTRINVTDTMYKAFLQFSDADPIFLGESKKEQGILTKANEISTTLGLTVRKNYQSS